MSSLTVHVRKKTLAPADVTSVGPASVGPASVGPVLARSPDRAEGAPVVIAPVPDVVPYATAALRRDGRLMALVAPERAWKRVLFGALAAALAIGFFLVAWQYWTPVHSGVDQNGYLVGGKQFADTLSMKFQPTKLGTTDREFDPHRFVGRMWVGADSNTPAERFYPKYPLGLPFLYAVSLWIGGRSWGPAIAYALNPVAMALAVWGTYLLARRFMGVFPAVLAMLIFATSSTTTTYTNNPNSHSTTCACVVWGMFLLVRWWQQRGIFTGFAAGFLLGYAVTIRYTEGTLVLPMLWVVGLSVAGALGVRGPRNPTRWAAPLVAVGLLGVIYSVAIGLEAINQPDWMESRWAAVEAFAARPDVTKIIYAHLALIVLAGLAGMVWLVRKVRRDAQRPGDQLTPARVMLEAALVCCGWLLPVSLLLLYNRLSMGAWTGYDATNESVGFGWKFFADNWRVLLGQLNGNGLVLTFPLAVAGLLAMLWWNWRAAVLLWLWVGPCLLIYTFYYWGPDSVGYLRFVLSTYPALAIAGLWFAAHWSARGSREPARLPLYAIVIVMAFAGIGAAWAAYSGLRFDLKSKAVLAFGDYFTKDLSPWNAGVEHAAFWSQIVLIGVLGAAVGAAVFFKRSILPTLAAGVLGFIAVAVQTGDSVSVFETDVLRRSVLQANSAVIESVIPPASVVVCRDEDLLNHLGFATDYVLYAGWTFDKGAVSSWPREETLEPVLLDPARGKALFERLGKFEQAQLDDQARQMLVGAANARRRVFVIEQLDVGDTERRRREKKPLEMPEFVRRFAKPELFDATRIYAWNVFKSTPDLPRPGIRGPRDRDRDRNREVRPTAMQIVEVKRKI